MKKIVLLFLLATVACDSSKKVISTLEKTESNIIATSSGLTLTDKLPVDLSIRKGVLENGMTYYLHGTDVTKDVASYYIIQNVGSVLENDEQQGLAHFLEHMAFNGTKNFPGKGILETLQKEGMVFGKDINAYTSFDETVYNLNNLPTRPELIETGLEVLSDWCNYLLLTEEEIDAERGVIKEEWRTRQSGGMRIFQKNIKTIANNSIYGERMPIGLMDIVENFEYQALKDFYHDWYRTDLQAIAIIGDFNVDEMETKVKSKFSSIPAIEDAPERFEVTIADNDELLYSIAMDPEVATSNISFNIRHPKMAENQTVSSLKEGLLNSMISAILSNRFSELTQKADAPFVYVGSGFSSDQLSRQHTGLGLQLYPKPNMQKEAFTLGITELNRAVKFGFTNSEIERIKADFNNYYLDAISKLGDRSHGSIIRSIQQNYLEDEPITDIAKEHELVKIFFSELTQAELLSQLQKLYTKKNRSVIVTGVESSENLSKEEARSIINSIENSTELKPYEDEGMTKPLLSGVTLNEGTIEKETENKEIGSTLFTLSNGINVHYKFVDKNKNKVVLEAVSDGGTSLLTDQELPSASLVSQLVSLSGLGEFSAVDLPKVLAGKTASTDVRINSITESIVGSSTTKDVETMLQLTNLRFTKPRFDEESFEVLQENIDRYLISKSQDIQSKMQDSLTVILYGENHPKKRLFDQDYVNEMSFDQMKSIYEQRFANAADFTFFITGDVSKDELKPLLEKYLASIPTTMIKEKWTDPSTDWKSKNIDQDVYMEMQDPKTSVRVSLKNDMEYSLRESYIFSAIGDILQLRYTESLREEEGGTYGAGVRASLSKEPRQQGYLSVNFDCNPELAEKLIAIVHQEMELIKNGTIQQNDLDKTLTNYLKDRAESKSYNAYDRGRLKNFVLEGYDINDPNNFENIINSITIKDIENTMKTLMDNADSFEIVFKPLK